MNINRAMRRAMKLKKESKKNWTCPNCSFFYPIIYVQSTDQPYLFCHRSCEEFFDKDGNNVTLKVYPGGKPWESEKK